MALAQLYVDPAINADSGTGTIGDPYGDLAYCLSQATIGAAGTQINIKAGTAEAPTGGLSVTTFGTPTAAKPLVLRGYTSAANDGGFGVISGGGTINNLFATTLSHVSLIDMRITNYAQAIISGTSNWSIVHCEIDTSGQFYSACAFAGGGNAVINSYIHNCRDGYGVNCSSGTSNALVMGNVFANDTYDFSQAVRVAAGTAVVRDNVFVLDGASIGVYASFVHCHIIGNSIRSSSGTGTGIKWDGDCGGVCVNNIIVGFSGSGGEALLSTATDNLQVLGANAYYNNATNNGYVGSLRNDLTSLDTALSSDPFVNAAGGNYALNGTITGVTEAAWPAAFYGVASTTPKADRGAVQAGAGAAGVLRRVMRLIGG